MLCLSWHDFLAAGRGNGAQKTKSAGKRFLQDIGFHIVERLEPEPECTPYIRDLCLGLQHSVATR